MFLIQDGHQTHTHVEAALAAGSAEGIIWSLGDETPANLAANITAPYMEDAVQAIDPQVYVAPLADANPKKIPDHSIFDVPMRPRDFAARNLGDLVERVLSFQANQAITHVLSPTVGIASMADRWSEVAANLADTSIADWANRDDSRPLLISVAVQEALLADPENVDALLDELTSYECEGFYLLMERNPNTDAAESAVLLERALYIVYALTQLNGYEVWVGYAGLNGFVFRAVGAQAFGAGWWQKTNWWSPSHWTPGAGGRQPRPRIHLESIIGSLLIDAELRPLSRQRTDAALATDLLAGAGPLSADFVNGRGYDGAYDRAEMIAQGFAVCGALDGRITGNFGDDMSRILDDIADAEVLHRRIQDVGVQLEQASRLTALTVWQTAITALSQRLGQSF